MQHTDPPLLRALEQFARVDAVSIDAWQDRWPDFFPAKFWDHKIRQTPPGVSTSAQPQLPGIPLWKGWQDVLLQAWRAAFPFSEVMRLAVAPVIQEVDMLGSLSEAPYQRALLLMASDPWRARFCSKCGKPFVALKANAKFCGPGCFAESRLNTKRRWWAKHGSEWRRKRSQRKKRGRAA
jgi:hypothetical protein